MERFEKEAYINIQRWMTRDLGLKSNELIIYAIIHGFCQDGMGYFYGSIKYLMENTNLSKETVLSVLQNLVKKGLIIKKDVKNIQVFDVKKTAQGSQYFCLYYTAISRAEKKEKIEDKKDENCGSKILTREEENELSRVKNLDPYGSRILTGTGQEFRPNNKLDNKAYTSTTSQNINILEQNQNKEVEEEFLSKNNIQEKLNSLFGYPVSFSPSPFPHLFENAKNLNLKDTELFKYLEWSFNYLKLKCKQKENFDGYFYKCFTEIHLMVKFKNFIQQKKANAEKKEKEIITCPVCGNRHNLHDAYCKTCQLDFSSLNNKDEILRYKKIFFMPTNIKIKYEEELENAEKEYPLNIRICNKVLLDKYFNRIKQIETKFGVNT